MKVKLGALLLLLVSLLIMADNVYGEDGVFSADDMVEGQTEVGYGPKLPDPAPTIPPYIKVLFNAERVDLQLKEESLVLLVTGEWSVACPGRVLNEIENDGHRYFVKLYKQVSRKKACTQVAKSATYEIDLGEWHESPDALCSVRVEINGIFWLWQPEQCQ